MADQTPLVEEETEAAKRRNRFMDQLLGEDFLEEIPERKPAPVRVKPAPAKVAFTSSEDTRKGLNYQLPKFRSTLPDRPKLTTIMPSKRLREEEEPAAEPEETISYLEDFSLRKAVIYSQILERKF